jgi:hypothetical protein
MKNFSGLDVTQGTADRGLVPEVALDDFHFVGQMVNVLGAASPSPHSEYFNILKGKQVIDEVTACKPSDSGDQYALGHHISLFGFEK